MKFEKMFFDAEENSASRECLSEGKIYIREYRIHRGHVVKGHYVKTPILVKEEDHVLYRN